MPGSTNFKQFNPNGNNQEDDAAYLADSFRADGAQAGVFNKEVFNKFAYQMSSFVAAMGEMLATKGYAVSDANFAALKTVLANILTPVDIIANQAFSAYRSGSAFNLTGLGTVDEIIFNSEEFDLGASYNITTGRFTPQAPGKYFIIGSLAMTLWTSIASTNIMRLSKNGVGVKTLTFEQSADANMDYSTYHGSCIMDMNGTTDYASIRFSIGRESSIPKVAPSQAESYFQGFRIG